MPSPYTQLLLVNMLLTVLGAIVIFDAPPVPAIAGALAAGALLHARHRPRKPAVSPPEEVSLHAPRTERSL